MMTPLGWLASVIGRAVDLDHAYGAQCVDLVNDWLVHGRGVSMVTGNAVDIMYQGIKGFQWIANGPTNAPTPGSVLVWHANVLAVGIGRYGHTAVAIAADSMHVLSLDQNWNGQPSAALVLHPYTGLAGWHQPLE